MRRKRRFFFFEILVVHQRFIIRSASSSIARDEFERSAAFLFTSGRAFFRRARVYVSARFFAARSLPEFYTAVLHTPDEKYRAQ